MIANLTKLGDIYETRDSAINRVDGYKALFIKRASLDFATNTYQVARFKSHFTLLNYDGNTLSL